MIFFEFFQRFFGGRHPGYFRRRVLGGVKHLAEKRLVKAVVVREQERIVERSHQQDISYPVRHQFFKAAEFSLILRYGLAALGFHKYYFTKLGVAGAGIAIPPFIC